MKNHLTRCLKSLELQNYPRNKFEIIVIDGGSTDGTTQMCKEFNVKCIIEKRRGRGLARNRGILEAKGKIIAFIDADCRAMKDWLCIHVNNHQDIRIGAVGGSVINPDITVSNYYALATHYENFSEFNRNTKKRVFYHIPTCNASFKKTVLLQTGLFNENLNRYEDFVLCNKIRQNGWKILFDPNAKIQHFGVQTKMKAHQYINREIEWAKFHFVAQTYINSMSGKLPTLNIFTLFFALPISIARIFREIYKLIRYKTLANPLIIPYIMFGGFVWGLAYSIKATFPSFID